MKTDAEIYVKKHEKNLFASLAGSYINSMLDLRTGEITYTFPDGSTLLVDSTHPTMGRRAPANQATMADLSRKLVESTGLTRRAAAAKCGVSYPHLKNVLTGRRHPPRSMQAAIGAMMEAG